MNDEKPDQLKEEFSALTKAYPEIKEMQYKIESLEKKNKEYEKIQEENKEQTRIFVHEIKTYLNGIIGLTDPNLVEEYGVDKETTKIFETLHKTGNVMNDLTGMLSLYRLSKEEIKKDSEYFALEDLAREHAIIRDKEMRDSKINLFLRYNRLPYPYHSPIEMCANKTLLHSIWGTLFTNSIEWAPKTSTIFQAFKIKEGNLEIIMENEYGEKKVRLRGSGKGTGTPFVKDMAALFGGSFTTYKTNSQMDKNYDIREWWGYKEGENLNKNTKIFGAKVVIPMLELTNPVRKNQ